MNTRTGAPMTLIQTLNKLTIKPKERLRSFYLMKMPWSDMSVNIFNIDLLSFLRLSNVYLCKSLINLNADFHLKYDKTFSMYIMLYLICMWGEYLTVRDQ